MKANTRTEGGTSADAIEHHYGTGNDYFSLWLGETMAYSCAMWDGDEENQSLDDAQLRKIEYHALQAHARDAGALLDIGCGWGGLLNHVVS